VLSSESVNRAINYFNRSLIVLRARVDLMLLPLQHCHQVTTDIKQLEFVTSCCLMNE